MKKISLLIIPLIFLLALPVSAEFYDYKDLVTDFRIDGENELITFGFPLSNCYSYVTTNSWDNVVDSFCPSISWVPVSGVLYNVGFRPYGFDTNFSYNIVSLEDIPNGTNFSIDFQFSSQFPSSSPRLTLWIQYFYSDGTFRSQDFVEFGDISLAGDSRVFNANFDINYPSDAAGFNLHFLFYDLEPLASSLCNIEITKCSTTVSIPALYQMQIQSGKTNQILSNVEKELQSNGQTLDQIVSQQQTISGQLDGVINRPLDPQPPVGSDKVDDVGGLEQDIFNDTEVGRDEIGNILESGSELLQHFVVGLNAVTWILNLFLDIPFLREILIFSLSLGIFAILANIGTSAISSAARSEARHKGFKGKGG